MSQESSPATVPYEAPLGLLQRVLMPMPFFLAAAGLASELHKYVLFHERTYISQMFSLSYEKNVPTWYSAGLLLVSGITLALIASVRRRQGAIHVGYWWGLSAAFIYISIDETVSIHEYAGRLVEAGGGFLYYDWVIPGAVVVLTFGLFYIKFLMKLPRWLCNRFILAGCVYVGGAMGVELFLGYWTDNYGTHNLGYGLIDLVEETMEMLGATVFLLALLEYLAGETRILVREAGASSPSGGGGAIDSDKKGA